MANPTLVWIASGPNPPSSSPVTTTGGTTRTAVRTAATSALATAVTERETGFTSWKTSVPSSISEPIAAVPMTSATSGRTVRMTSASRIGGASRTTAAESDEDADQRPAAARAGRSGPSVAARASARSVTFDERAERRSSAHQVAEDALERVVGRRHLVQA